MALLTGYHLLGVGIAGFLFVPSARIWGKRHVYLIGTVVLIFSSAWGGGNGRNYKSLLAARIWQGVGLAPFEALVNASVGDLYHVHQRGIPMALSNLALFGGAFFTPVLVGKISSTIGYTWTFYFVAIFAACMLPLVVFCVPETTYRREDKFDIDTMGNLISLAKPEDRDGRSIEMPDTPGGSERAINREGKAEDGHTIEAEERHGQQQSKITWKQSLMPFNGRKTDESYLHLLLRPFTLFLHPGILWVCIFPFLGYRFWFLTAL